MSKNHNPFSNNNSHSNLGQNSRFNTSNKNHGSVFEQKSASSNIFQGQTSMMNSNNNNPFSSNKSFQDPSFNKRSTPNPFGNSKRFDYKPASTMSKLPFATSKSMINHQSSSSKFESNLNFTEILWFCVNQNFDI